MIEALDEAIKQLLIQKMPLNTAEVEVSFDVPNRQWSGAISKPTINIYLHDIRENIELRRTEWSSERDPQGRITKTRLGGRYDLSYLITAWTTNVEDEHRLLSYVLATLVRYPYLPAEVLDESLRRQPYPLSVKVAQPDGILRNAADVWTALDNQLKPVLTYVVTSTLDSHLATTAPEVRSRFLRFVPPLTGDETRRDNVAVIGDGMSQFLQIGGHIFDQDNPDLPISRAEVVLVEQGLNTRTDTGGRYTFGKVAPRPEYTFLVVAPGYVTTRQVLSVPSQSYDFQLEPEN